MRAVLRIAWRDLRSRLRDRSAWIVSVVAPVALAVIIATAFSGGEPTLNARVALVDLDGGPLAQAFARQALGADEVAEMLSLEPVADRDAAARALRERRVDVAVVLHPGMERIEVLQDPRAPLAGEVVATVADVFAAALAAGGASGIELTSGSAGAHHLSPASYFGPGMAMLFVFFTLAAAPRSLLAEARDGTLARLRAAPIAAAAIPLGKALAAVVLGFLAMVTVWGVTAVAFSARWGPPLAVLAVLVTFLAAAAGIATLASVYARSDAQADGAVAVVAFVLALVGGNFLLLSDMPPGLRTIASLTPNGQALQAFLTMSADGGGLREIVPHLAAILAFAAAAFAASAPGLRRLVAS